MTNSQKYKTADERGRAFGKFCGENRCENCVLNSGVLYCCMFAWLDLEAEEEILPCPFCGGKCVAHDGSDVKPDKHGIKPYSYVECTKCGYRSRTTDDYEHEGICNVIKEHNRMVIKLK